MTDQTPPPKRRDGRSRFLALRETVTKEVEKGHTARSIYERHFDQSGLSYSQFARYVAKYVRQNGGPDSHAPTRASSPPPFRAGDVPQPVQRQPSPAPGEPDRGSTDTIRQAGFRHDPKPDRNKLV